MKTIKIILSFLILGLYSCGDESTNPTPKPNEEIKKYTLEEILTDSNWVEIIDTMHYEDINGFTYLNKNWQNNQLILFNTLNDYNKIESESDTAYEWYKPNSLKYDIDFNLKTLIGVRTETTIVKKSKLFFKNDKLNDINTLLRYCLQILKQEFL